jgi:hypothetical protein
MKMPKSLKQNDERALNLLASGNGVGAVLVSLASYCDGVAKEIDDADTSYAYAKLAADLRRHAEYSEIDGL